jgi:hypothetical protein
LRRDRLPLQRAGADDAVTILRKRLGGAVDIADALDRDQRRIGQHDAAGAVAIVEAFVPPEVAQPQLPGLRPQRPAEPATAGRIELVDRGLAHAADQVVVIVPLDAQMLLDLVQGQHVAAGRRDENALFHGVLS